MTIDNSCAYCGDFLEMSLDECYIVNTWGALVRVPRINDLNADNSVYCSKSCHNKESK